ncbi:hypothetical protein HN865_02330 [Candidatus Woesearchaeota archaeon]|jgi:hypothetical protein|nr:hypothetical protein [Candidatus Woesearchaeota archaeon]MBT7237671.1 hypothetical protein [Candidatus Woesearchaeota archaeon]
MASVLRGTIEFLQDFGLFDVVLPFLLIFAIIFAILEKTLILGKESDGGPKKNLNSIVALVIALLFVSANKAVNIISTALPNIALMIVIAVSFLMMLGVFWKTEEFDFKDNESKWYVFFSFVMFVALALIFMGAYQIAPGISLLSKVFSSISGGILQSVLIGAVVIGVIVGIIVFVTKKPKGDDD